MFNMARQADLNALAAAAEARSRADEITGGSRAAAPPYQLTAGGTALITIAGPITKYQTSFQSMFGGSSTVATRNALRQAVRDPNVKGILLIADSPGGTTAGVQELAADVRAAGRRKAVHAYVDDLAASAAVWAISGASRITANEGAEIGSIGCYMVVVDTSGFYTQEGVKVHVVSSAPPYKGAGVDGAEVNEEQLAEWKRMVDGIAGLFTAEFAKGRRMPIGKARELADGRMHLASAALELGLIDGIGSLDEAIRALEKTKMKDPKEAAETAARMGDPENVAAVAGNAVASDTDREALVAQVAALTAKNEANEKQVAILIADNRRREVEATIAASMDRIPGLKAATLIAIAASVSAETFAELEVTLKGANELIKQGAAFSEVGTSGSVGAVAGGAHGKLDAHAADLRKQDSKLTKAQAFTKACDLNPELVRQARTEKKGA